MKYRYMILTSALLLLACHEPEQPQTHAVPVRVDKIKQHRTSRPVVTSGLLKAEKELRLSFKIGGFIDSVCVLEGEQVVQGQCLAVLKLDEIKARVQQARSGLDKARRDYNRVKKLYTDSVTTLEQLQNAETALEMAHSDLKIADFNLRHARITAPSDGYILSQLMDEHEMVAAGHPVFFFGQLDDHWALRTSVTESDVIRLNRGDRAIVVFDAFPDRPVSGYIKQLSGTLSPKTGTYPLEIILQSVDLKLKSGFVARVKLIPGDTQIFNILPVKALVEADGSQASVYSVENGRASKHAVKIAFMTDDSVLVEPDLSVTEIITDGAAYLSPGMPVIVEQNARPEL
ncbi:MAG: efflux RND transporter periplasmic adaptor subunit [candidate division KSB1 bacterium]|nr:efflux RND transporter periplasmic adaptor subunit [candidate division KSB1 bacterium]